MRPMAGLLLTAVLFGGCDQVAAAAPAADYAALMNAAFARSEQAGWNHSPIDATSAASATRPVTIGAVLTPGRGGSALAASTGRYDLAFTPQLSFDGSDVRGPTRAGGVISVAFHAPDPTRRGAISLDAGPVPTAADGRGRWFLFAAASGQVVGLNMTSASLGLPQRALWAAAGGQTLISDSQAGLGWRRGAMQASFGYVHREVHYDSLTDRTGEPQVIHDSMLGLSISFQQR